MTGEFDKEALDAASKAAREAVRPFRPRMTDRELQLLFHGVVQTVKALNLRVVAFSIHPDYAMTLRTRDPTRTIRIPPPATKTSPDARDVMVYLITAEETGRVKIGAAIDPTKRLVGLQTSSPEPLSLLAITAGGYAFEKALHGALARHRVTGEWFRRGPWLDVLLEGIAAGEDSGALLARLEALSE